MRRRIGPALLFILRFEAAFAANQDRTDRYLARTRGIAREFQRAAHQRLVVKHSSADGSTRSGKRPRRMLVDRPFAR